MLMLASATQKEVESVSDNIEQLSKDVSKLSQIGSDLIDKAVAFGIDIIIAVIIFVIGKFIIKFILKFVDRIFAKSSADEGVAKFIKSYFIYYTCDYNLWTGRYRNNIICSNCCFRRFSNRSCI